MGVGEMLFDVWRYMMWTIRRLNKFYDQEIMIQYGRNVKSQKKAMDKAKKLGNAVVFYWNIPMAIFRNGIQSQ